MVFLLGRQQSMPGLAGVFLQRCGECSELDAASLPLPSLSQYLSQSHQLFQRMTNSFPGVAFPCDSSHCAASWDAVPGGYTHVLDSALQRVSMTIKAFFFPFQVLLSPMRMPGQFSHKLDLLFAGELTVTTLRMCRVTLVTAS